MRRLWSGVLAGAAGSTALNMVTYLDMTLRARPPSQTPEISAGRVAEELHLSLGDEQASANRRAGLGPLLGNSVALATAAAYAVVAPERPRWATATALLTAALMVGVTAPMAVLKVTDPRRWSATDWTSDIIPHLAYGAVAASTYRALRR